MDFGYVTDDLREFGLGMHMGLQVIGGFMGCVSAGYLLEAMGRWRGPAPFALGSALSAWAYVVLPLGAACPVFAVGFPLGFFDSGIFSALAVYMAVLYCRPLPDYPHPARR